VIVVAHDVHTLREEHTVDVTAWIDRARVTIANQTGFLRFEAACPEGAEHEVHILWAFTDDAALGTWTRSGIHDALMHPLVTQSTQRFESERHYRFGDDAEDRAALDTLVSAFAAALAAGDREAVGQALDGFGDRG
jgi:antibiotic biosynthesis monooxygenase (ABM) superfamily enzyme